MNEHELLEKRPKSAARPVGYEELRLRFALDAVPNWHSSFVSERNTHHTDSLCGITEEIFPLRYWPGNSTGEHLEFALKYDGVNLALLAQIFHAAPQSEITEYVASKPRGKYARRIWFFYEMLTEKKLPLNDLSTGGYIDLLEPEKYYTATPRAVRRQRIYDNLLGNPLFCPIVRRTETLQKFEKADLSNRCRQIVSDCSPSLLKRAIGYFYAKETKSSFEIEQIHPNSSRTERFVALLRTAESEDFCDKTKLLELQNRIVDPRFQDKDYRNSQNYVGEHTSWQEERIHFVGPKPSDLPILMSGLLAAHQRLDSSEVSPVVHAAVIAFGFVFLHPFEDGNGRIHRFLIHNILARKGFTPKGWIFPISATMLKSPLDYDASLESFSRPLMERIDYTLDEEGRMEVRNETALLYQYIDMTGQVESLFRFIERTIETELVEELIFLENYDRTRSAIQEIVDMPDKKIDIFIRLCLQNAGRLSPGKRKRFFDFLSDEELAAMEKAVQSGYNGNFS